MVTYITTLPIVVAQGLTALVTDQARNVWAKDSVSGAKKVNAVIKGTATIAFFGVSEVCTEPTQDKTGHNIVSLHSETFTPLIQL